MPSTAIIASSPTLQRPSDAFAPPPPQALPHQQFTDAQHLQLRAQILVHSDLVQGKPPSEATMARAFGESVDDHQHSWEDALRVAVDRVQNQRSPTVGLQTPISSQIGKFPIFCDTVDDKQHQWEDALRVAVDGVQNQRSPTTGLHTPISSHIGSAGSCTAEQNRKDTGKNISDIHNSCSGRSVPNSPQNGHEGVHKEASTVVEMPRLPDKSSEDISSSKKKSCCSRYVPESPKHIEMHRSDDSFSGFADDNLPVCTKDKYTNAPINGLMEGDICVKCGKHGQLLKCRRCLLAAHAICFGPSVIFDDSGQFDCPVCLYSAATEAYKKAEETYFEALKNLSYFLGPKQLGKQHNGQYIRKQQRSANVENCLHVHNTYKRQGNCQRKADTLCLSHNYEETGQQNVNSTGDACPEEAVAENPSFGRDSDAAPMSKHSILHNSRDNVHIAGHEPPMEKADNHEKYSSHVSRTSQTRCSPVTNRHHKVRFQEKGTVVSNSSKKALGCQDQHTPSLLRKRCYLHQLEHYSNPVTPALRPVAPIKIHPSVVKTPLASTVRRARIMWTEEEETTLREAVEKFAPKDKMRQISWVQILEYGRDVFHKARRSDDLRAKWKYMMNKQKKCCSCRFEGSGVV